LSLVTAVEVPPARRRLSQLAVVREKRGVEKENGTGEKSKPDSRRNPTAALCFLTLCSRGGIAFKELNEPVA
jgi:hypothetical protein